MLDGAPWDHFYTHWLQHCFVLLEVDAEKVALNPLLDTEWSEMKFTTMELLKDVTG